MDSTVNQEDNFNNHRNEEDISTLLSRYRTTLSFQRTRLSADRTLMSIIRTSLSLIGFGFTIFQFFRSLKSFEDIERDPTVIADRLGLSLVAIGIALLFFGIIFHGLFMLQVRRERNELKDQGLIPPDDKFPVSLTLIGAIILLALGIYVIITMIF